MGNTYGNAKRSIKSAVLKKDKEALRQLGDFSNIVRNMERLNEAIDNYEGLITAADLDSVCDKLNKDLKLKLTEDQIRIVRKQYEQKKTY